MIQFREKLKTIELTPEQQARRGLLEGFIQETFVMPYVMDLNSTNKTFLNGKEIEAARYYELRSKDVLKFGNSDREYVVMRK